MIPDREYLLKVELSRMKSPSVWRPDPQTVRSDSEALSRLS